MAGETITPTASERRGALAPSFLQLMRSRLGRSVTIVVFAVIVVIEGAILVPSYLRQERELLNDLRELGRNLVTTHHQGQGDAADFGLLARTLLATNQVSGVLIVDKNGRTVARIGEEMVLPAHRQAHKGGGLAGERTQGGERYEVSWGIEETPLPHWIAMRLNSAFVAAELSEYVLRNVALVLLIAVVLTVTTMVAMGFAVLRPLLELRHALAAGEAAEEVTRASRAMNRRDEIGEVFRATMQLLGQLGVTRRELERRVELRTTELSHANEQLRNSELRFKNFSASSSDFYWELDADLKFSYVSERFTELTDIEVSEVVGGSRAEMGSVAEEGPTWEAHLADIAAHRPFRDYVRRHGRRDGSTVYTSMSGDPLHAPDGSFLGYRGTGTDVTERKEAERQLQDAKDAAESYAKDKAEIVAVVNLEIRTPMNGVLGMAQLLRETRLEPSQAKYVDTILNSGEALLRIVDDLLDSSKLEAGRLRLESNPFIVGDVVEHSVATVAARAADKGLELDVQVDAAVPPVLRGDAHRLQQVLTSLLSNAVKFTERGRVAISASLSRAGEDEAVVKFTVSDTGIGIRSETREKLFSPSMQESVAIAREFGGAGLGLMVCRQLVELMGGEIWLESEVAVGSTFGFELTLTLDRDSDAAEIRESARRLRRATSTTDEAYASLTILQVEDNDINRDVLESMLRRLGHEVYSARDGTHALELIEVREYDLILMDRHMPKMNGIEATRAIRALDPPVCDIPIIGVTAGASPTELDDCLAAGMDAALTKPINVDELYAKLREIAPRFDLALPVSHDRPVLVVDDIRINLTVIGNQLEKLGLAHDFAESGEEALRMLAAVDYAMAFVDVSMPGMDGLEVSRRQREADRERGRHTPIVAMTGYSSPEDRRRFAEAGMDDTVAKPVRFSDLAFVTRKWMAAGSTADIAAAGDGAGDAPFDLVGLGRNIGDDDRGFLLGLVGDFIAYFPELGDGIAVAARARDRAALHEAAHKAKGAAASMVAEPLRRLMDTLENEASELAWDDVEAMEADIAGEFERFKAHYEASGGGG